jgi:hypothetical protein
MSDSVTNRFEVVNCQACGRRVARKSRQQRYCSDRCRDYEKGQRRVRKSFLSTDTRASPNPLFLSNKNNELRGPKSGSSIPLNVLGGYRWPNSIAVDGDLLRKVVRTEIKTRMATRADSPMRYFSEAAEYPTPIQTRLWASLESTGGCR